MASDHHNLPFGKSTGNLILKNVKIAEKSILATVFISMSCTINLAFYFAKEFCLTLKTGSIIKMNEQQVRGNPVYLLLIFYFTILQMLCYECIIFSISISAFSECQ